MPCAIHGRKAAGLGGKKKFWIQTIFK